MCGIHKTLKVQMRLGPRECREWDIGCRMSKPLQGTKFKGFRDLIMGTKDHEEKECPVRVIDQSASRSVLGMQSCAQAARRRGLTWRDDVIQYESIEQVGLVKRGRKERADGKSEEERGVIGKHSTRESVESRSNRFKPIDEDD